MNVSAQDKATGKQQSIVIKASSGLSDDEIDRMVADAEAHADEDAKQKELIDVRNTADTLIHQTEKSMTDLEEQMEPGEKEDISAKLEALREVATSDDKDAIESKIADLSESAQKLAERAYTAAQQEQGQGTEAPVDAAGDDGGGPGDDAVDAEFEEVKDDKG